MSKKAIHTKAIQRYIILDKLLNDFVKAVKDVDNFDCEIDEANKIEVASSYAVQMSNFKKATGTEYTNIHKVCAFFLFYLNRYKLIKNYRYNTEFIYYFISTLYQTVYLKSLQNYCELFQEKNFTENITKSKICQGDNHQKSLISIYKFFENFLIAYAKAQNKEITNDLINAIESYEKRI